MSDSSWRPKEDFMPFFVQDYLAGTVVLSELMCGKPRLKDTSYTKLGFLKFQDIPFTYFRFLAVHVSIL